MASREIISVDGRINSGNLQTGALLVIEGEVAHHTTRPDGTTRVIQLDDDLFLSEGMLFAALKEDLGTEIGASGIYRQPTKRIALIVSVRVRSRRSRAVSMSSSVKSGPRENRTEQCASSSLRPMASRT